MEYIIEINSGKRWLIMQGAQPAFSEGEKVLVLYGTQARIIVDKNATIVLSKTGTLNLNEATQ